jgi:hypothetical protein
VAEFCSRDGFALDDAEAVGAYLMCRRCGALFARCGGAGCGVLFEVANPGEALRCASCGWVPQRGVRLRLRSAHGEYAVGANDCVLLEGKVMEAMGLARTWFQCVHRLGFLAYSPASRSWVLTLTPGNARKLVRLNGLQPAEGARSIPVPLPARLTLQALDLELLDAASTGAVP